MWMSCQALLGIGTSLWGWSLWKGWGPTSFGEHGHRLCSNHKGCCANQCITSGFLSPPKEYIHRVGRTARGLNGRGHALLILRPEELGFLRYLKQSKVRIFTWKPLHWGQIPLQRNCLPVHTASSTVSRCVQGVPSCRHSLRTVVQRFSKWGFCGSHPGNRSQKLCTKHCAWACVPSLPKALWVLLCSCAPPVFPSPTAAGSPSPPTPPLRAPVLAWGLPHSLLSVISDQKDNFSPESTLLSWAPACLLHITFLSLQFGKVGSVSAPLILVLVHLTWLHPVCYQLLSVTSERLSGLVFTNISHWHMLLVYFPSPQLEAVPRNCHPAFAVFL